MSEIDYVLFFVTKKTAEIIATLPIVNFSDTLLPLPLVVVVDSIFEVMLCL